MRFFLSYQRKLVSSAPYLRRNKVWMPHRPVFLPLTLLAEQTGIWHDEKRRGAP